MITRRLRSWRWPTFRPGPVPWDRELRAVVAAVVLGVPVAVLALLIRTEGSPLVALDETAIRAATDLTRTNDTLRAVLLGWQTAFQALWVNTVVALICLWVWRAHRLRNRAVWAFTTIMVSWALALGTKYVVQRARPVVDEAVELAPGFSFPSGHVANTTTAALAVAVLLWPLLRRRGRVVVCVVGALVVVLTSFDRVLLGVHFPSDALAGIAFAAAVVGGSYLGYVRPRKKPADVPSAPATADSGHRR